MEVRENSKKQWTKAVVNKQLSLLRSYIKEEQNFTRKLLLCSWQKHMKTKPAFWTTIFQKKNLHFSISNELYICRKINLFLTNSIYLVFISLEIQRRAIPTKYTTRFFTLFKKNYLKTFKNIATSKHRFSSVNVIVTTCFDKCFLFYVITGKQWFL